MVKLLGIGDARTAVFFEHPHVNQRHLSVPLEVIRGAPESTGALQERFKRVACELATEAVKQNLATTGLMAEQIDMLCCVTSTGFLVPSLSALLMTQLNLKSNCHRLDIVGMGCQAGINGLSAVSHWCAVHPGRWALLICGEICSAIYSSDSSPESGLVNSLFGDGVTAILVQQAQHPSAGAQILGFSSHIIAQSSSMLRFEWNGDAHRYRFVIDRKTPKILSEEAHIPLHQLLRPFSLEPSQIQHWLVHTGGEAILQAIETQLHLPADALRHSRSVLRDLGNISSGSFFVSYDRLVREGAVKTGDLGVMMTMGPGLGIEMALLRWGPDI